MLIGDRHLPGPITPWTTADDTDHDVYPSSTLTASDYGPITLRTSADDTDPDVYHSSPLTASDYGPYYLREAFAALQRYLPSNEPDFDSVLELPSLGSESPVDAYSCDHFRMYEFKVRSCARGRSHDWTECPYAHPGEKARRRDPRRFHYSGSPCPDFRKGSCRRGDGCEFAHGVFECWLHPDRYRTQPCKDGTNCRRRVCFFAHTAEQLRVLSPRSVASIDSYDGSPLRQARSISSPADSPAVSPPMSPVTRPVRSNTVNEIVASLRNLQLNKVKSLPPSWSGSGHGSPRGSILRPCFSSLPSTPTAPTRSISGWDNLCVEEPAMERVESGRGLRAKMFEKLSKENSLVRADPNRYEKFSGDNDIGWVSELFK